MLDLAEQAGVEASVHVVLCRDRVEGLESVLGARAVVIAGEKRLASPTGYRKGNHDAGPVLRNHCRGLLRVDVGLYQGLRPALTEESMDYIIAGIVTVLLFGYLIYALLRPERF